MKKQHRLRWVTLILVVLFLFTACKLPSVQRSTDQPDQTDLAGEPAAGLAITETLRALDAVVAQTLAAAQGNVQLTEAAPPSTEALQPALFPSETPSPLPPPSDTPTPTDTPTLGPPSATPSETPTSTPEIPTAYVNENTNCRSGPGKVFGSLYIAPVGTTLVIVSNTTLYDYVIVENPEKPGTTCWLWTTYVEISGNLAGLPVATPPPTPTPTLNFSLAFVSVDSCVGWDPAFKVTNTGDLPFKSYQVKVTDENSAITIQAYGNSFDKRSGCAIAESIPELAVGGSGYGYASSFSYNPSGHSLNATVTLCTGLNQTGACMSKSLKVTP